MLFRSISVVWCTICILMLLLRRPNAPVHPGVAVGLDLIIWLAYIVTGMIGLAAVYNISRMLDVGLMMDRSGGGYREGRNGTLVWDPDPYDVHHGRERDCTYGNRYNGYGVKDFASCAEQDAFVNALWKQRQHRLNVVVTGSVCQFICLVLHFALFVWACVDTHRRNRRRVSKDAQKLANDIVLNMVKSGAVVRTHGDGQQLPLLNAQQPQGWAPEASSAPMQQGSGWHAGPVVPPLSAVRGAERESAGRFA